VRPRTRCETALEEAGFELAEDVSLPCANNRCEQNDVGARRLANAGVDAVFSFLGAVTYPAFVGEAEAQGFVPQWFSSDFENQVFATVAQFMAGVAGAYDGAIGTTAGLDTFDPDGPFVDCNARFTAATGIEYEFRTDPWQAVGNSCEMIGRIVRVLEAVEDEGRALDQAAFIEHMEQETVNLGDRRGRFGPDKHDAYDVLELRRFSEAASAGRPSRAPAGPTRAPRAPRPLDVVTERLRCRAARPARGRSRASRDGAPTGGTQPGPSRATGGTAAAGRRRGPAAARPPVGCAGAVPLEGAGT
jgi:hypothetical protein